MTEPGRPALGVLVRRSLGWSVVNNLATRTGTLITGIVLARVLVPSDYGEFAVALVALQLLLSLNDVGLSTAVIRWPGDVTGLLATAWTLVLVTSGLLFAAAWFAAPPFAAALGVPHTVALLRVMSVALLVDGAVGVHTAVLTRQFQQGRRALADGVNLAVYAVLAVVLAHYGLGAWSMVWGRLAGNSTSALIIWRCCPVTVRLGWDARQARRLLFFGVPLAGSSLLVVAVANADYVVVGRLLGPVQLGLYLLAFNLSSWPVNMFSFAVRRVSIAAFAQLLPDRRAVAAAFAGALGLLLALSVPVCVLLSALGRPVVLLVYGSRWASAVPALQVLALLGLLRIALELAYDLLVSTGRSTLVLWLQSLWLVIVVPALVVGAQRGGIRGVAVGQLLVVGSVVVPAFVGALRQDGIEIRAVLKACARPLAGGGFAVLAAWTVVQTVPSQLGQLLLGGGLGVLLHTALVWPMRSGLRGNATPAGGSFQASGSSPSSPEA